MFTKVLAVLLTLFSLYFVVSFGMANFASNSGATTNMIFFGLFLIQTYGNIKLFQLSKE